MAVNISPVANPKNKGWFSTPEENHFVTFEAKFRPAQTKRKRRPFINFAEREAKKFSDAVRSVVAEKVRGKRRRKKKTFCRKFGLASRVANLARNIGEAMVLSAEECLKLQKDNLASDIESLNESEKRLLEAIEEKEEAFEKVKQKKRHDARLKIDRLRGKLKAVRRARGKKQRRLERLPERPHLWVGGKRHYHNQPAGEANTPEAREAWKKEWELIRNNQFGARGSSDETGGNSTYRIRHAGNRIKVTRYLGSLSASNEMEFEVTRGKRVMGVFRLGEKEGSELKHIVDINNVPNQSAKVRTPVKVMFRRRRDLRGWDIGLTVPMVSKSPVSFEPASAIGVDLNHGHFESCMMAKVGDHFELVEYHRNTYDTEGPKHDKKRIISERIRTIVHRARETGSAVVLESLDFEGAKRTLRNKLGATLHQMPYREIRAKFVRECEKQGVILRFVYPRYTSVLGNILATKDVRLSRDVAAAGVIALFGLPGGRDYLMREFKKLDCIRINQKSKFGRHVSVAGWDGCQCDSPVLKPDTTDEKSWLRAGALIQDIAAETGASKYSRRSGRTVCRTAGDDGVTDTPRTKGTKPRFKFRNVQGRPRNPDTVQTGECSSLSRFG